MQVISLLNSALTGRYSVEREAGAGGMATVYVARDLKHDRLAALKVLGPELAAVLPDPRSAVRANLDFRNGLRVE